MKRSVSEPRLRRACAEDVLVEDIFRNHSEKDFRARFRDVGGGVTPSFTPQRLR